MTLPGDNLLAIYTSAQNVIAPPLTEAPVDGARLAALPGGANRYPLVKAGRYFLWGMTGAPSAMTDTGKQLFLNLARFATEKWEIQLRARTFTPITGAGWRAGDGAPRKQRSSRLCPIDAPAQ
jgi:hypothetical protein